MSDKTKSLFEDLGRATLRGVRKCPKCGTFNGIRGLTCKNKACQFILKLPKEKSPASPQLDAVKLITSSNLQIYSVKQDDKNRCFVHLPIIEGIESLQDAAEITIIKQSAAMCYAPMCLKPMIDLNTINLNLDPCVHTHSIVDCVLEAQPLAIKDNILKVLPIPEEIKEEIYSLVSKSDQLVQRINKHTMVIRCNSDDKHFFGILHCSVFELNKSSKKFRVFCECQTEFSKPYIPARENQICVHLYMCLCAFASDVKLLEEFKFFIQSILNFVYTVFSTGSKISATLIEKDPDLKPLKGLLSNFIEHPKKRKIDNTNSNILLLEDNKSVQAIKKVTNQISPKEVPVITFEQWLASVTERINQTMHYQFDGYPEPLVFHAPQVFFDILQQRISNGATKKRLPNSVVGFSTKYRFPFVCAKFTWHITNILHVKQIFDTIEVPLEVTQSFVENKDGTYVPIKSLPDKNKESEKVSKAPNKPFIKPWLPKTFLKVGKMSLDQKEPIPFIIEWIPDILPKTHVGELKITFQYGHERNGKIERRDKGQVLPECNSNV